MENNNIIQTKKEKFTMPKAEIIIFDTKDVIMTSPGDGGFPGEWDEEDIPLQNNGFRV